MPNLTDARFQALRDQSYTGHVNDMVFAWLADNGGTGNTLADRWRSMLIAQGATPGHRNDMWFQVLRGLGYTGSLNDMELEFWGDGGVMASYSHNPVVFDGTSDWLTRGAALDGDLSALNGIVIYSHFTIESLAAVNTLLASTTSYSYAPLLLTINTLGGLVFSFLYDTDGAGTLLGTAGALAGVNGTFVAGREYQLMLASNAWLGQSYLTVYDVTNSTLLWDGEQFGYTFGGGFPINWAELTNVRIGANFAGAQRFGGSMSCLWVALNALGSGGADSFFNVSSGADRDLGAGEVEGLTPSIFFGGQQTAEDWNAGTNQGNGGPFTMNGTPGVE